MRSERQMFEQSFKRPSNYFQLSAGDQWRIDENLGILDWSGEGLSVEDVIRFRAHYDQPKAKSKSKPKSKAPTVTEARELIAAWESLPMGNHTPSVVTAWLVNDMKPVIDKIRNKLNK